MQRKIIKVKSLHKSQKCIIRRIDWDFCLSIVRNEQKKLTKVKILKYRKSFFTFVNDFLCIKWEEKKINTRKYNSISTKCFSLVLYKSFILVVRSLWMCVRSKRSPMRPLPRTCQMFTSNAALPFMWHGLVCRRNKNPMKSTMQSTAPNVSS